MLPSQLPLSLVVLGQTTSFSSSRPPYFPWTTTRSRLSCSLGHCDLRPHPTPIDHGRASCPLIPSWRRRILQRPSPGGGRQRGRLGATLSGAGLPHKLRPHGIRIWPPDLVPTRRRRSQLGLLRWNPSTHGPSAEVRRPHPRSHQRRLHPSRHPHLREATTASTPYTESVSGNTLRTVHRSRSSGSMLLM
jgi:hypothetical protein